MMGSWSIGFIVFIIGIQTFVEGSHRKSHLKKIRDQRTPATPDARCPSGWTRFNSYCYFESSTSTTWDQAKAHCEELGGELVKITSAEENEFVLALARKLAPTVREVWIGLKWNSDENDFVWADQSLPTYKNWGPGEPTADGREQCAVMWLADDHAGKWNDRGCGTSRAYPAGSVCKRIVLSEPRANSHRTVTVSNNGCASVQLGDVSYSGNPTIPAKKWIQTPSVVHMDDNNYRALGRVIHMSYLKEQLETQYSLNFDATKEEINVINLEIQADVVYIEGAINLHGVERLTIYSRNLVGSSGSSLDVSPPNWNQVYTNRVTTASDGEDGRDGINGPTVEIYANTVRGAFSVIANGGAGHRGQDGGPGQNAADSRVEKPDKLPSVCTDQSATNCYSVPGVGGDEGERGGNGGDAGAPGSGGNAGQILLHVKQFDGKVDVTSCRGSGAEAANNGPGGMGGLGSLGGYGRTCEAYGWGAGSSGTSSTRGGCKDKGLSSVRGDRGERGDPGESGKTSSDSGADGTVDASSIQPGTLDQNSKNNYPIVLLRVIKRQAEDWLWKGDVEQGRKAFQFIIWVTNGRNEEEFRSINKAVARKLGFLDKDGYDIFGKNELFAPRIKWEALKTIVEDLKNTASEYESAYNDIKETIEDKRDFQQISLKMSTLAHKQVKAEKDRLVEARNIAESEKRLYVQAITALENEMKGIVAQIRSILPGTLSSAQFNEDDFLAVLQGIVGFAGAIADKNPLDFIGAAVGLAQDLAGKRCPLGTLKDNLGKLEKWLQFGEAYEALENSSDLDFDRVDVSAIPEVMQADLEQNSLGFAADMVCLLEESTRPRDVASFKQKMESFFTVGASRIDLIGKVMDLDNEIGGYNFDIPLLGDTEQAINNVGQTPGGEISKELQVNFLDNLLSTYQELETSLMREVYELHKAFRFRTLWEGTNPLSLYERVAVESANGVGRLNGIIEITNLLRDIERTETKAVKCFTNNVYTTDIQKWSFDKSTRPVMFADLERGSTRFSIKIDQSCSSCYNIRLLKLYVELTGTGDQPPNVPATVHLRIRHLSGSRFRAGDDSVKEYRQPLGSFRKIKFRRTAVSDETKCGEEERKGNKNSIYCVTNNDYRWHPMCSHPLSQGACVDRLLGEEECRSPFGTYELLIPKDDTLSCDQPGIRNKNCKDLDLTKFTKMNVWAQFLYWSEDYPTGPDDRICRSPWKEEPEPEGQPAPNPPPSQGD